MKNPEFQGRNRQSQLQLLPPEKEWRITLGLSRVNVPRTSISAVRTLLRHICRHRVGSILIYKHKHEKPKERQQKFRD